MRIKDRIKQQTPPFWKKVGNYCLVGGIIVGGIGIGLDEMDLSVNLFGMELKSIFISIGATMAAVGKGLSKLVIND